MPIEVMYRIFTVALGVYVVAAIVFRVGRLFWTGCWNRNDSTGADGVSGSSDNHDGDGSDAGGGDGGGD